MSIHFILKPFMMQLDLSSTSQRTIIDFRELEFSTLQVLGKYNYTKAENQLPEHTHVDMIEICYCDKGKQHFYVGKKKHLVSGGDVFINYPNELHGTGNHFESKGALYWLIIKLDPLKSNDDITYLCNLLIEKDVRHFKGNGKQKRHLEALFKLFNGKHTKLTKIQLSTLANVFILSLLDSLENSQKELIDDRFTSILSFINNNLTEDLSIANLAKQVNLSESRFKVLFKEITGLTPNDYVQRQRVLKAVDILKRQTDVSLSELAYQFNFSSPQYFSTVVRKYTGTSPSSLRQVQAQ